MNILSYEVLRGVKSGAEGVHANEVVHGLLRLGHKIVPNMVPGEAERSGNGTQISADVRLSLLERMTDGLVRSRILRPFRGGWIILGFFLREIYLSFLAFVLMTRRKGKIDVVYRRHVLFNGEYLLAKLFRIPLVKEVNGIVADEAKWMDWGGNISLGIMDRIERFNMPKADKIIVVTSRLKEVLQADYGVHRDKIVVILNGANTHLFKPMDIVRARTELSLNQGYKYVCFAGRLYRWLGVEHLIRSIPLILGECPDTRFLVVGDGEMKQELIKLAELVGVSDKVIFTGMVPYQNVPLYINASDVCVLPAANNARNGRIGASPLKLHEYMACGRPVVVGNVAGVIDEVTDADSGLIVDPTSADELAGAVITLLGNEELRKEMGKRGREAAVEKHSWRKVAEQVAGVCRSVVQDKGGE